MAIRNELKKKCVNYTDGLTGSSCRQRPFDYNEKQLKKKPHKIIDTQFNNQTYLPHFLILFCFLLFWGIRSNNFKEKIE
jgi:hypothetical protein